MKLPWQLLTTFDCHWESIESWVGTKKWVFCIDYYTPTLFRNLQERSLTCMERYIIPNMLILVYLLSYKLHFVTVIQRFCLLLHFKNFITIFVCKLLYCILIPRNNYISILVNLGLDSDKSIYIWCAWCSNPLNIVCIFAFILFVKIFDSYTTVLSTWY
jgi:hypothetical protein